MVIESKEQLFYNILNECMLLNEKRIELQNDHPVTTEFFSDKESAYEKISDIIKQSSVLDENKKKALFDKLLKG